MSLSWALYTLIKEVSGIQPFLWLYPPLTSLSLLSASSLSGWFLRIRVQLSKQRIQSLNLSELPPNLQIAVMPVFPSHSPHGKHISTHPSVENHPRGSAQEVQTPSSRTRAYESLLSDSHSSLSFLSVPRPLHSLVGCPCPLFSHLCAYASAQVRTQAILSSLLGKSYPWGCQSRSFQ